MLCVVVGAAAAATVGREADISHGAAEAGRDEGSPAEGAAGLHHAAFRSGRFFINPKTRTSIIMS